LRTPLAALLITMSTRPNSFASAANSSLTLSGMPTLALITQARRPSARISAASDSASSWLL